MTNMRMARRSVGFAAALMAASLTAFTIAAPALAEGSDLTTEEVVETPIATADETIAPTDAPRESEAPGETGDADAAAEATAAPESTESARSDLASTERTAASRPSATIADFVVSEQDARDGILVELSGFTPDSALSMRQDRGIGPELNWTFSASSTDSEGAASGVLRPDDPSFVPWSYSFTFSDGERIAQLMFTVNADGGPVASTPSTTILRSETRDTGIPVELSGFHPDTVVRMFVSIGRDGEPFQASPFEVRTDAEGKASVLVDYDLGMSYLEYLAPGENIIHFSEWPYDAPDQRWTALVVTIVDDLGSPTASPEPTEESGSRGHGSHGTGHGSHHAGKGSSAQANASGALATTGGEAAPGILVASVAGALGLAGAVAFAVARRRRDA